MTEIERRWKRGMEKIIKEADEGTGSIEARWKFKMEKEEDGIEIYLTGEEIMHITRKLYQIPTHMKIKEEVALAQTISRKLLQSMILGDPETMFKGDTDDE